MCLGTQHKLGNAASTRCMMCRKSTPKLIDCPKPDARRAVDGAESYTAEIVANTRQRHHATATRIRPRARRDAVEPRALQRAVPAGLLAQAKPDRPCQLGRKAAFSGRRQLGTTAR